MRSTAKTVLFARAKVNGKITQNPIAVFPNDVACRAFAVDIVTFHRSGDAGALKALGVGWLVGDDGSVAGDLKMSKVELPYAPERAQFEVDPFGEDKPAAS